MTKAVEDAYHTFMMQHKYPFTCLHIQIKGSDVDVNVHPTKMEVRFSDQEVVYRQIYQAILQGLQHKELIPQVTIGKDRLAVRPANRDKAPEPFEVQRRADRTAERISDAAESATGRVEKSCESG